MKIRTFSNMCYRELQNDVNAFLETIPSDNVRFVNSAVAPSQVNMFCDRPNVAYFITVAYVEED